MALTVKRVQLWRNDVESRPGLLAGTLGTLASAGADLQVVIGQQPLPAAHCAGTYMKAVSCSPAPAAAGSSTLLSAACSPPVGALSPG